MAEVLVETVKKTVGRLAPSPTGALHLGNVRTFMLAWLSARSKGGRVLMRMEDLDHPRDKPGAAAGILDTLRWLGFDWDEEYTQSSRRDIYREALRSLGESVYPCVCSRRDVECAQSAPHEGEQLFYPGTCRDRFRTWEQAAAFKAAKDSSPPCWRFRVPPGAVVGFDDLFAGRYSMDVSSSLGDFPLARDEGGAGYTFACVVDDVLSGVTEVVRADDLLAVTPAQILLARALYPAMPAIAYCHVPLVTGPDGKRLAKRHGDTRIEAFRRAGFTAGRIIGALAASCGWCEYGEEIELPDLVGRFSLSTVSREKFVFTNGIFNGKITAEHGRENV